MKIETITDDFGHEHILVYKSETEWQSYPKDVWDELEAQREQSGTL